MICLRQNLLPPLRIPNSPIDMNCGGCARYGAGTTFPKSRFPRGSCPVHQKIMYSNIFIREQSVQYTLHKDKNFCDGQARNRALFQINFSRKKIDLFSIGKCHGLLVIKGLLPRPMRNNFKNVMTFCVRKIHGERVAKCCRSLRKNRSKKVKIYDIFLNKYFSLTKTVCAS